MSHFALVNYNKIFSVPADFFLQMVVTYVLNSIAYIDSDALIPYVR